MREAIRRRAWLLGATLGILLSAATPARPVLAADPSVTLAASAASVSYGDPITLSGAISPPTAGQTVAIATVEGGTLAQATTDAAGTFSTDAVLERNTTLHAVWQSAASVAVDVGVRPVLTLRFTSVRLFDSALVRGTVAPPHPGMAVTVAFRRGGRTVAERHPEMNANGGFTAHLPVREPGTYRVRATFGDEDHVPETAVDGPTATPLPSLRDGSHGTFVRLLERRLVELRYRLAGVNEEYDQRTGDAVMAFTKVQRMTRRWTVDASVWRALADPRQPTARSKARGFHVEVDQTRQVLYTVDDGEITNILHVSTGAGGATHDGSYRVYRKLAGFSGNHLYYPSYFDGLRAIHGWTEVPSYPASHGCVRVPYWNAQWIFGLARTGTTVLVYH